MSDLDLSMPAPRQSRWRAVWPWLLIVWGAATTVTNIVMVSVIVGNAQAARTWPTTMGRIEASSIRTVTFSYRMRPRERYEPHVEYSYAVAGHAYWSAQISWGGRGMYQDAAEAWRDLQRDYPVGRAVPVFYDPDHPATAILVQDNYYWGPFVTLPLGPLLFGIGIVARRRGRSRPVAGG